MKFFEIHTPYYALLKADTKDNALGVYVKFVADNDGSLGEAIKEVDRDYALARFSRSVSEDKQWAPISQVLENFRSDDNEVLIIDRDLL